MADVFISYRKADRPKAEVLAKALKIENLDVWWDAGLETGQTFDEKIQSVLEQAKAVIVIWSKESVKSDWVRAESSVGRERGILVPVMIQSVNIPVPFNLIHTADLRGWNGDRAHKGYQDVVKQVKELAGKTNVRPLKPPPDPAIRALWRAVSLVAVIAVVGASTWFLRPWEWDIFSPEARAAERAAAEAKAAKAKIDASRAKLAPFGIELADFDTLSGREIAWRKFKPEMFDQLKALSDTGEPAAMGILCAVHAWGAPASGAVPEREMDLEDASLTTCTAAAAAGDPLNHVYFADYLTQLGLYDQMADQKALDAAEADAYRKAAEAGVAWGEYWFGRYTWDGEGMAQKDPAGAEAWLKRADAQGLPDAKYWLGQLYLSGAVPYPDGPQGALAMMRQAADMGSPAAQQDMCDRLSNDMGSLTVDLDAALAYCRKAMEAVDPQIPFRTESFLRSVEALIAARDSAAPTPPTPPT